MNGLQFLKLGGSLITEKDSPHTARPEVLARLAGEIRQVWSQQPGLRLVLGHGSGSFGHVPAKRYGTRQGVHTHEEWLGFAEVWREASTLNRLVLEALHTAGLPAVAFPPSASIIARDGQVESWNLEPLQAALRAGLLPVVYGDVVFDSRRGGTILSTEDLFGRLARELRPERMLLAGREPGVWADYPACTQLIEVLDGRRLREIEAGLGGAVGADVTGGMASKVRQSRKLVQELPHLEVLIFSGETSGAVRDVLSGARIGTQITL